LELTLVCLTSGDQALTFFSGRIKIFRVFGTHISLLKENLIFAIVQIQIFWKSIFLKNARIKIRYPEYFWGFYGHRLHLYRDTEPHYGFQILKKIANLPNVKDYFIITSNVDGHFQKAGIYYFFFLCQNFSGFPEEKIYEVHGSINYLQCSGCDDLFPAGKVNFLSSA